MEFYTSHDILPSHENNLRRLLVFLFGFLLKCNCLIIFDIVCCLLMANNNRGCLTVKLFSILHSFQARNTSQIVRIISYRNEVYTFLSTSYMKIRLSVRWESIWSFRYDMFLYLFTCCCFLYDSMELVVQGLLLPIPNL